MKNWERAQVRKGGKEQGTNNKEQRKKKTALRGGGKTSDAPVICLRK